MTSVGSEELKLKNPREAGEIKPERMSGRGSGCGRLCGSPAPNDADI